MKTLPEIENTKKSWRSDKRIANTEKTASTWRSKGGAVEEWIELFRPALRNYKFLNRSLENMHYDYEVITTTLGLSYGQNSGVLNFKDNIITPDAFAGLITKFSEEGKDDYWKIFNVLVEEDLVTALACSILINAARKDKHFEHAQMAFKELKKQKNMDDFSNMTIAFTTFIQAATEANQFEEACKAYEEGKKRGCCCDFGFVNSFIDATYLTKGFTDAEKIFFENTKLYLNKDIPHCIDLHGYNGNAVRILMTWLFNNEQGRYTFITGKGSHSHGGNSPVLNTFNMFCADNGLKILVHANNTGEVEVTFPVRPNNAPAKKQEEGRPVIFFKSCPKNLEDGVKGWNTPLPSKKDKIAKATKEQIGHQPHPFENKENTSATDSTSTPFLSNKKSEQPETSNVSYKNLSLPSTPFEKKDSETNPDNNSSYLNLLNNFFKNLYQNLNHVPTKIIDIYSSNFKKLSFQKLKVIINPAI